MGAKDSVLLRLCVECGVLVRLMEGSQSYKHFACAAVSAMMADERSVPTSHEINALRPLSTSTIFRDEVSQIYEPQAAWLYDF